MSIVNKITKAVAGNPLAKAEFALKAARENLEQRQAELVSAEAALEAARAARQGALAASADDAELDRQDAAVERTELLVKRARERVAVSQELHSKAEANHAAEKARADSERAQALAASVSEKVAIRYPKVVRELLELCLEIAEARVEIARLGGGPDPEASRRKDWLAETVLRDDIVELLTDLYGQPLDPQPRPADVIAGDGGLYLNAGSGRHADRISVRRRHFRRVKLLESQGRLHIEPLYRRLELPNLMDGDGLLFSRLEGSGDHDLVAARLRSAIKALDGQTRAAKERRDDRQPVTRWIAIDPREAPNDDASAA